MTPTTQATSPALEAVRQVTPEIAARADEIDQARKIPADLLGKLTAAGAFRHLLPREVGGEELDLVASMRLLEEISAADGSTGWTVMIGADMAVVWARFRRDLLAEVFAAGPDVFARGAFAPRGVATAVDGGYRIRGQWPLASGSFDFQWVLANAVVAGSDGAPVMTPLGVPETKLIVVPAGQATFTPTWNSMGLRATTSDDFVLDDVFVPTERTGDFMGPGHWDSPLFQLPFRAALGPSHAGVALGIARGALADVRELAKVKRPAFNPGVRIAQDPVTQSRVGQLEVRLAAARAYAETTARDLWDQGMRGEIITPTDVLRLRSMVAHVHTECMAVANEAFSLAGSNALYLSSSLQRRWRDIRAASQHAGASTEVYQVLGALAVGEEVPPAALL